MRILLDHGTPAPLRSILAGHTVREATVQGWDTFKNGDLLIAAEAAGFDGLITTDKNMRYEQNLTGRTIAIIVLGNAQGPVLRMHVARVAAAPGPLLCSRDLVIWRLVSCRSSQAVTSVFAGFIDTRCGPIGHVPPAAWA